MKKEKQILLQAFEEFIDSLCEATLTNKEVFLIKETDSNKILSFAEVCQYFKVSSTTLERYIRAGLNCTQAVKKGNRLFKLSECEKFFNLKKK